MNARKIVPSLWPAVLLTATLLVACKPATPPAAAPHPELASSTATPAAKPAADGAAAGEQRIGPMVITGASTRETPVPGVTAVGFLSIRNTGAADDTLLAARSPDVGSIEIHEMSMNQGVMRMRALTAGLPIPAGATVRLGSGGTHLMLIGTKSTFTPGETVNVELQFAKAGTATVTLKVEPLDAAATDGHADGSD